MLAVARGGSQSFAALRVTGKLYGSLAAIGWRLAGKCSGEGATGGLSDRRQVRFASTRGPQIEGTACTSCDGESRER